MRYTLHPESRKFFLQQRYVELAELLSTRLLTAVAHIEIPNEHIVIRNLWKTHPILKKISLSTQLAEVAAELTQRKSIRIAFDQYIATPVDTRFLLGTTCLQKISCITPLTCGLLLRCTEGPHTQSTTVLCPCPTSAGSGIFFFPTLPLDWHTLLSLPNQRFLLIAYTDDRPQYILEQRDLFTHDLKRAGYVFGDFLRREDAPRLYPR